VLAIILAPTRIVMLDAQARRSASTSRISRLSGIAGGSGSGNGKGQPGRGSSA